MKRYRLLRDLPFAKAGAIVELWSDGTMAFACEPSLPRFNKKDVRWFPHWFGELEEYFYISTDGHVFTSNYNDQKVLADRKLIGNYFETREEAEKRREQLKAEKVLLEDTKGFKPNWEDPHQIIFTVYYHRMADKLKCFADGFQGGIIFETEADAQASIDNHEKEWKIYLGVE